MYVNTTYKRLKGTQHVLSVTSSEMYAFRFSARGAKTCVYFFLNCRFAIQDGEKSDQMTVALEKGKMAGWKCHSLKDRHILPIQIRITITLITYK